MTLVNPAIVIGGGSANGLGIAWNLGRRGVPVYCVTSNPNELLLASKYCRGYSLRSEIESHPLTMLKALRAFRRHIHSDGVLFPTTDTALLTVAQIREHLEEYVTYIPDQPIVETMVIKSKFYRSLRAHKIPHPRTLYPDEIEVDTINHLLHFPVYIRPAQTLLYAAHFSGKGFVAPTLAALHHYLRLAEQYRLDVMIQEIIPGPVTSGYTLRGYLDAHSQPQVLYATQKLRQPTMFSNNTAWVTIPLSDITDIASQILHYLQAIGYQGLFGAEFKRDPRDGRFKVLEINARSMGGNYLGAACGANHVLAAYNGSIGAPFPSSTYRPGVYYINFLEDLIAIGKMSVKGHLSRHELLPFVRPKQWQQLSRDDPLPFLKLCRYFTKLLFTR